MAEYDRPKRVKSGSRLIISSLVCAGSKLAATKASSIGLGRPWTTTAVGLQACGAQPREAVGIEGSLPGEEFLFGKPVTPTSLLDSDHPASHRREHGSLAADNPPFGGGRGKINHRERLTGALIDTAISAPYLAQASFLPSP